MRAGEREREGERRREKEREKEREGEKIKNLRGLETEDKKKTQKIEN